MYPNPKKRILLFNTRRQFGYRIDAFEYCRLLCNDYDVIFYSLDFGLPRIELPGVTVIYKQRHSNKVIRYLQTLSSLVIFSRKHNVDLVFLEYFYFCSIVNLFLGNIPTIMDIRTGGVSASRIKNWIDNTAMLLEHYLFKNVTVISGGVAGHLHLDRTRCFILPIGAKAQYLKLPPKSFETIRLLYVGDLHPGRMLKETILGFDKFVRKTATQSVDITYDIVGDGPQQSVNELKKIVNDNGLSAMIRFHGFVPHEDLDNYFRSCNVGVNFIPMTSYFDHQPPTKLFEYSLAGMAIISTRTSANMSYFHDDYGVAVDDTAESFCEGLELLLRKKERFDSDRIKKRMEQYSWEYIVQTTLAKYLNAIVNMERK